MGLWHFEIFKRGLKHENQQKMGVSFCLFLKKKKEVPRGIQKRHFYDADNFLDQT